MHHPRGIFAPIIALTVMLLVAATWAVHPAAAQRANCNEPRSQAEMTVCAGKDLEKADRELNRVYKLVRAAMVKNDAGAEPPLQKKGFKKALIQAQRAWITYRDRHCEIIGLEWYGGSGQSAAVSICLAAMTRARTAQLKNFLTR
ncbi:MAG: lysozyme inhibitor LprI family protein [Pseudomonadota bacterium]